MGFTVSVVGKSKEFDWTEFCTSLVRIGEIEVSSVKDMVHKVSHKATEKAATVDRLDIFAHGSDTYFQIGEDVVHSFTPKMFSGEFSKLKRIFSKDGIVVLDVCDVGQCETLIKEMAVDFGVNVYARRGGVSPNLGIMWGQIVVGRSDGSFQRGVRIPVDPWDGVQS